MGIQGPQGPPLSTLTQDDTHTLNYSGDVGVAANGFTSKGPGPGLLDFQEGPAPPPLAGSYKIWPDSGTHAWMVRNGTGPAITLGLPIYSQDGIQQYNSHIVRVSATLSAGTATVQLFGQAVFASASSYVCLLDKATATKNSGSSITLSSSTITSGAVAGICVGN